MENDRIHCFLDTVKLLNFLKKENYPSPLFLFENTWPGKPGQNPKVDKAAELVKSFLGAPVVIDVAGLGSSFHRVI